MIRINHKAASVNDVYKGRRFRNDYYNQYERDILFLLPKITMPEPPYKLTLVFGFSSKASDLDNTLKPLIDCMQKKYKFNDKLINELNISKVMAPKGKEFFEFEFVTILEK